MLRPPDSPCSSCGCSLPKKPFVVVDVLDVVDADAGLVFELGDGAVLARVDVAGPVGDRQLAADRAAFGRRHFAVVAAAAAVSPPQAARPSARPRSDRQRRRSPAPPLPDLCSHHAAHPLFVVVQLIGRRRPHVSPGRRLADQVHVLGLPAQRHPGAAARQPLALGLVGVGDEHGHPHVLAEVDDDLRRGAEVERALDDALDLRQAVEPPAPPSPTARPAASPAAPPRGSARRPRSLGRCAGDRRARGRAAPRPAPGDRRRHQVGDADEAGDEGRRRALVDLLGDRPTCSTRPRFITAIRSLIVSASSWSWVT